GLGFEGSTSGFSFEASMSGFCFDASTSGLDFEASTSGLVFETGTRSKELKIAGLSLSCLTMYLLQPTNQGAAATTRSAASSEGRSLATRCSSRMAWSPRCIVVLGAFQASRTKSLAQFCIM